MVNEPLPVSGVTVCDGMTSMTRWKTDLVEFLHGNTK